MQDDGEIGPHIDYQGRLDQSSATSSSGSHGDHCAGTIMGSGNLDPKTKGMASGAFLHVYGSSNNNYYDVPNLYQNYDVTITSKSYSDGCNAGYTSLSSDLDEMIYDYPSLMHVFSAGNNGTSDCGYGAGSNWGNVTGGHKQAKNVIACGRVDFMDNLASSSSRGPAADGRIKPDICAKGSSVYSTVSTNDYDTYSGTSMSCPGVSGSLALLYQGYKELNWGFNPKSGLIKAIVLNTAEDLGNNGPDFKHGWGRINVDRAYKALEENRYTSSSIDQGISNNHIIDVPVGVNQIKVMVYWNDEAASSNSSIALVNNLNIELTQPNGTINLPLVLDYFPNASNLDAPAIPGVDNRNNMEQVVINNPLPGSYDLEVIGFSVPFGPQEYFVTYEFITDEIFVTYPVGGESFVPGETEVIRWDAFGNSGNFAVEYSTNNGNTWNNIGLIQGSDRHCDWIVPSANAPYNKVLVRVSRGVNSDQSDSDFSIINIPQNFNINWVCPDSIFFSWNPVSGVDGYEISMLGNKYMDSIFATSNTAYLYVSPSNNNEGWFAIRSLINTPNGIIKSRRSLAEYQQTTNNTCVAAPIASFSTLGTTSCSGIVKFNDESSNQPNNWLWDFGDGNTSNAENPSHLYSVAGIYNVSLIVSNSLGQDTILQSILVDIDFLDPPNTINDTAYVSPSTFTLYTQNSFANWYIDTLGSSPIYSGNIFNTPLLNSNTTYYVQDTVAPSVFGGPPDNNIGTGSYYNNDRHLFIDCYTDCKLVSADVYAGTSQAITFELRDNNSQVIDDTTINVQAGLNTLYLDFDLPVMNNLELGVSSANTNLYRNSSGASYPYLIGDLASITGHNSPYASDFDRHYFFYNLQLQQNCLSEFASVEAVFSLGTSTEDNYNNSNILIYPNPSNDIVNISLKNDLLKSINIYDTRGKIINSFSIINNKNITLKKSDFSSGVYFIEIIGDKCIIQDKIIFYNK